MSKNERLKRQVKKCKKVFKNHNTENQILNP